MNRSIRIALNTFAAAIGAFVLTLTLAGCGTLTHSLPEDAIAGIVPSGRGAP